MQHQSLLLKALDELDGGAWAEMLMPLLITDKSAASFALTCKLLAHLCHSSQKSLQLSDANCAHLLAQPAGDVDVLQRCFPACTHAKYTTAEASDLSKTWILSLRMLARLPGLSNLSLEVQQRTSKQLSPVPSALELIRLQLTQLRSLRMSLWSRWPSDIEQACWRVIADMTQLTFLMVSVFDRHWPGISSQYLTSLRSLSGSLQFLGLWNSCPNTSVDGQLVPREEDYAFVSCLAALTGLMMPIVSTRRNLTAISHCTALRDLRLEGPAGSGQTQVREEECAALQQLVRLTRLCLPRARSALSAEEAGALSSALRALQMLQVLRAYVLDLRILPALASLTSLASLSGSWREEQQQLETWQADITCSSVQVLNLANSAAVPYKAFPGVKTITLTQPIQPEQLLALVPNCWQHLTSLTLPPGYTVQPTASFTPFCSLNSEAPMSQRAAAIRSLASLRQLCSLQFAANDNAEALAVGSLTQLTQLTLCVPQGSQVTGMGLAALLRLSQLQELMFYISNQLKLQADQISLLLCGLEGVSRVGFRVDEQHQEVIKGVVLSCAASGLAVPGTVFYQNV